MNEPNTICVRHPALQSDVWQVLIASMFVCAAQN